MNTLTTQRGQLNCWLRSLCGLQGYRRDTAIRLAGDALTQVDWHPGTAHDIRLVLLDRVGRFGPQI